MSNTLKLAALAVLAGTVGAAHADPVETKGGIKVKTEDGRFQASIGGRIQYDYYSFSEDNGATIGTTAFGSAAGGTNRGGGAFRRAYLTLAGKAYGWEYKYENDFARASTSNGRQFREMWIATDIGPGKIIIGQHKPFRGMEEMASSNEITFMERPNASASGIYENRQFLTGLFYKGNTDSFGYGLWASTLGDATQTTEGHSFGGRAYWFPMADDGNTVHLGLSYSSDREDASSAAAAPVFSYGGRRGIALGLGNAGASATGGFGTQNTIHGEIAGSFGSFTAQAEYAMATLENAFGPTASPEDADVTSYYVQASYFITGEKKVYKKDRGAFGSPKPINDFGAVEVALRYEASENSETANAAANGCSLAGVAAGSYQKCEGSQITLGANWYVNPNVRFMLNYYMGTGEVNSSAKDEPEAISLRAQMSF
jgi:phosphate-selective porin OprO and OprP